LIYNYLYNQCLSPLMLAEYYLDDYYLYKYLLWLYSQESERSCMCISEEKARLSSCIDFGRAFTQNFRLWIQRNYFEIVVTVEMLWDPVFSPIGYDLSEIFMIETIERAIRIRISKNRQHNGLKKKYKRTNNDQQTYI
jgi:hypothetical protein